MIRPTLLAAWELGAGRGHLEIMRPIIAAIIQDGWNVVAAVRDVGRANIILKTGLADLAENLRIVQAPIFVHRAESPSYAPRTLTDIFAHIGFGKPELVRPLLLAWAALLDEIKPQALLADTAPGLLAANQGRIPTVVIGNGWTVPPDIDPTPAFDEAHGDVESTVLAESRILAAIRASGFRAPRMISQLTHGHATFVFTPTEIDPYRRKRVAPIRFPPNVRLGEKTISPSVSDCAVYLPLKHPAIRAVVTALEKTRFHALAYFGGQNNICIKDNIHISENPLDLEKELPKVRFVIHHGGLGISSWCIAHGLPQIVIATDLEKHSIGKSLAENGLGISVNNNLSFSTKLDEISHYARYKIYSNELISCDETISAVVHSVNFYR